MDRAIVTCFQFTEYLKKKVIKINSDWDHKGAHGANFWNSYQPPKLPFKDGC